MQQSTRDLVNIFLKIKLLDKNNSENYLNPSKNIHIDQFIEIK